MQPGSNQLTLKPLRKACINIAFILPPEVDIDSHEEDEENDEERPPVKSHRHPPISPALRVRETLEYGREGDDEREDDEGATEEADL